MASFGHWHTTQEENNNRSISWLTSSSSAYGAEFKPSQLMMSLQQSPWPLQEDRCNTKKVKVESFYLFFLRFHNIEEVKDLPVVEAGVSNSCCSWFIIEDVGGSRHTAEVCLWACVFWQMCYMM